MKPHRKKRLLALLGSVAGVAIAITIVAIVMKDNFNLFLTPSEVIDKNIGIDKTIKVGGLVQKGSIKRAPGSLDMTFVLADKEASIQVMFSDVVPDLFKEGQGAVVTGQLNQQGVLMATSILAKHDENYMSPQLAKKLEQQGHPYQTQGKEYQPQGKEYQPQDKEHQPSDKEAK